MIAAIFALQPLAADAQSRQPTALKDLTIEQVWRLRANVLERRAEALAARGTAFDQRSKTDMERALRPETDLYFEEGLREKARDLRQACGAQDWSACTALGKMYADGEGTWIDEHLAFAFHVTACIARDPDACAAVFWNWRIDAGSGRYEGHAPYFDVFTEACENGHAESCNRLSIGLRYGVGRFSKDETRADEMLKRACRLGVDQDCSRLPKTPAEQAAQQASQCESGRQLSCFFWGEKLIVGDGIERDVTRGETLIREGCDQGEIRACKWVIEQDTLDIAAQADLLARGCVAQPGSICNDAARLFESLPATDEIIARFDQVMELACGSPHAYCVRQFWVKVERAANELNPFDPAADQAFSAKLQPLAARLRVECYGGLHEACHQLARLYAQDPTRQRSFLAAHVLRPSCDAGDGAACLLIVDLIPAATSVERVLYKQACAAGTQEGCLRSAITDVARTPTERLAPVQDACSEGSIMACRMQAEFLAEDAGRFEGGRQDRARAQALFLYACDSGDTEACYRYGRALAEQARRRSAEEGLMDKALDFLERACAADNAAACSQLGGQYEFEADVPPDAPRRINGMIRFYSRACALDPRFCESQARATVLKDRQSLRAEHGGHSSALMDHDADFKEYYRARVRRYRRDCQAGDMDQCINLGERYIDALEVDGIYGLPGSTPHDFVWARALFDLACDAGNARGCVAIANYLLDSGLRSEPDVAIEYSHKSCALGAAQGCFRLASAYFDGEYVAQDLAAAVGYLHQSCDLGMDYGCQRLTGYDLFGFDPASEHDRKVRACVHGSWFACGSLRDDLRGLGANRRNRELMREFGNIACDEGYVDMCRALGRAPNDD